MAEFNQFHDGDWTIAQATTVPKFSAPFDGDKADYLLEQDFIQDGDYFAPLPLNTPHDDYAAFFLVKESTTQPAGGGSVKWTRTYAAIPAMRNDFSSLAYNFIGYAGAVGIVGILGLTPTQSVVGRNRFTKTVTCRIQNDYFLCATGQTYATPQNIPTILSQKYYFPVGTLSSTSPPTLVFTPTYTPGSVQDQQYGLPTDSLFDSTGPNTMFVVSTQPSRTTYQNWIIAGTEIVAADSELARWMGNIYVRTTKYVVAQ